MATTVRTFKRYTVDEYIAYLQTFVGRVKFTHVHVHGTWKPTIADFRKRPGDYYMQAMYRAHLARGFSDIAQHATIDPDGYIWEGRSLLSAPASATGYNDGDDDRVHPFMFEMIGNFDIDAEKLEGAQLEAAVKLTRAITKLWGLATNLIVFHREINTTGKTCPGSGIVKADFVALVTKEEPKVKAEDANAIITKYLQPAYYAAKTKAERDEAHRLAEALRVASGQKT